MILQGEHNNRVSSPGGRCTAVALQTATAARSVQLTLILILELEGVPAKAFVDDESQQERLNNTRVTRSCGRGTITVGSD